MRLHEFLESVGEDELPLILLDGKRVVGYFDADDAEGWVVIPDLQAERIEGLESMNPNNLGRPKKTVVKKAQIGRIRKEGKVEFRKIRRPAWEK